ncbi:MAG: glycosyltransferase [Bacteroidales bacterium]|nr:glycosyltransferase [Bacteroidales bacterium]
MKLSIVIVNYNVAYFLEQALYSVYKALKNIDSEVFVVDNHSADGSLAMLHSKFPQVKVIANEENVGFAKANNQAIRMAKGEFILLLNPDTIVEEDTFEKCIHFMEQTPDAGGLGVKMVNGHGDFLPESKRGIPFPSVAFYKLFGLSKIFPHSQKFGSYHLTYLNNDEIHSVEVLSGAFMMLRKSVLDQIGLLDEDYFMYGEDIDLSYRIIKGGYKNYYFPETRIIHYKGESTKKGSLNYVYVFYKAMQIFAQKHFSQKNAKLFNFLINCAIWFRASLSVFKRFLSHIWMPLIDFIVVFVGMFAISQYWDNTILALRHSFFPDYYFWGVIPIYILVWLISVACCRGYQKPIKMYQVNKGIIIGTIIILLIYALLPEYLRFSRAVVVLGAMWTIIVLNIVRYFLKKIPFLKGNFEEEQTKRLAIVGTAEEAGRVMNIVQMMGKNHELTGIISSNGKSIPSAQYLGDIKQIGDLAILYRLNEIIFCSRDLPAEQIINLMGQLQEQTLEFKIAPEDSATIIGSNSIFSSDDLYTIPVHSIVQDNNLRKKRALDIAVSMGLLLFCGVAIWFVDNKKGYFHNVFSVLNGDKSWIGCQHPVEGSLASQLKPGVLFPIDAFTGNHFSKEMIQKAEHLYTRNYNVKNDLRTLYKGFSQIGRIV